MTQHLVPKERERNHFPNSLLVPSPRRGGLGRGDEWQIDSTLSPSPALPAEGRENAKCTSGSFALPIPKPGWLPQPGFCFEKGRS